ncbi:MAG: helix-turn-helix domain-containing protein [Dehalococcoidia bacterium]|nr:helix-turn-helix domain-containing protein [Dehalococcoidia bacterium]
MKIATRIRDAYTLGQIIQQGRLQRGVSQRALAKELNISQKWVWEMEQGKPGLMMDRLFLILDKTGVSLSAEFEVEEMLQNE